MMDRDARAREIMHRLRRTLESGENEGALAAPLRVSSAEYTDPAQYAREVRDVVRRRLLPVAPLASLGEAGARACKDLVGDRLLATRDDAGALHVMGNRCRHRGTLLVDENDCTPARRLVCPYHGWTYDLDGSLAHVPERDAGFPGLRDDALSLPRVASTDLAGMLWASLDAPCPSSPEAERLREELAGFRLETHRVADVRRWPGAFNWKLGVSAFLETYHFKIAHKTGIAPHFVWNRILVDAYGESLRLTLPRTSFVEQIASLPEERWELRPHVSFVYFIFPCSFLSILPDHASFISFLPDGLAQTRVESHVFVPEQPPAGWSRERSDAHWDRCAALFRQTITEDMALCESVQRGLTGKPQEFVFARFENAVAHFRDSVQRIVSGA